MDTVHLGKAGIRVSRLCLGTMNFGPQATEAESRAILDRALELGLNFVDTADMYGGKAGKGVTEEILGRWLAQGGRRERIVLASKVYGRTTEEVNDRYLSAYHIRSACESSLKRLQTDHLDLYQMHHVDVETSWDEIWQAMEQLHRQGKILYVGSSNFAGWQIATAQGVARSRNFLGLVSEQSVYNLTKRTVELEVLPACRYHGLGVIPYSPLAGGILAGALSKAESGRRAGENALRKVDELRPKLVAYEAFCKELGSEPAAIALAWTLVNPAVAAPIIGPRTLGQLESCMKALDVKLDAEALRKIDEIFPGPGGEAPKAYAW